MSPPLISVITVVYQERSLLKLTIESVLRQSYPHLEYIIIDGGSEDGTIDVIKGYQDRLDYWVSEPDRGIYDAMNKGLEIARGDGVLFLNSGDYIVGDIFKDQVSIPSYLRVKTTRFKKLMNIRLKSHRRGLPNCHQGILFERSELRYNISYQIASDYDYFLRFGYSKNSMSYLESDGYIYYDPTGISSKYDHQRDAEINSIILKHFGEVYAMIFSLESLSKRVIKWMVRRLTGLRP